jgi:GT2 family glycosyltransferase
MPSPDVSDGRPVVRVVVINFDGGDVTMRCVRSLIANPPSCARLEIVMVDNASVDGVIERVRSELPGVVVIESLENLGFAGGCNLGIGDLDGIDYVALINNDAYVEGPWLDPLVEMMEREPGLGAACPKILFAQRVFDVSIEVSASKADNADRRELGVRLSGARCGAHPIAVSFDDRWWHMEGGLRNEAWSRWSKGPASVRIPIPVVGTEVDLLLSTASPTSVTITSRGSGKIAAQLTPTPRWISVRLPDRVDDVINNVGSNLYSTGYGGDRGFLDIDTGQYDHSVDVFAWCGGAVLLRSDYLRDVGMFDERFFLYYEDTDLAWRGKLAGWTYKTVPQAVVRHEHAMSSGGEDSPVFRFHVDRNRVLVLTKCAPRSMAQRAYWELVRDVAQLLRHQVFAAWFRGRRHDTVAVSLRFRSLRSATALMPGMFRSRRRIRSRAVVPDAELRTQMVSR